MPPDADGKQLEKREKGANDLIINIIILTTLPVSRQHQQLDGFNTSMHTVTETITIEICTGDQVWAEASLNAAWLRLSEPVTHGTETVTKASNSTGPAVIKPTKP
uniref:Uncharacterized protein n=1 Tax=Anopheles merus TaxID=30066 RepID=A0A182UNW8_ANOME